MSVHTLYEEKRPTFFGSCEPTMTKFPSIFGFSSQV